MTFHCNTKNRPLQPETEYIFMETIYLCIVIFLFVLAIFDLMVGVSNDAVNFLNSAMYIACRNADGRCTARCF